MAAIFQTTFSNAFIFLKENIWILINISLKFAPKGPINTIPVMVQKMTWHRLGDNTLSEPMMVSLQTQICVTRFQPVYSLWPGDAIRHQRTWSTLVYVIALCRQATSHYLNQRWPPDSRWINAMYHQYNNVIYVCTKESHVRHTVKMWGRIRRADSAYQSCVHWNRNAVILTKFSPLAALQDVILTTFSVASDEDFVKITPFCFSVIQRGTFIGHNHEHGHSKWNLLWSFYDDVIKWKPFPRYWPFVRGIHRSRWIPRTKASDAELWCFLWSTSE